jgi:hypothetical protein
MAIAQMTAPKQCVKPEHGAAKATHFYRTILACPIITGVYKENSKESEWKVELGSGYRVESRLF